MLSEADVVHANRRFLLEWLSFMHRYIPVGLLEQPAAALTWRMPTYVGRNDLETLFASDHPANWVRCNSSYPILDLESDPYLDPTLV